MRELIKQPALNSTFNFKGTQKAKPVLGGPPDTNTKTHIQQTKTRIYRKKSNS